MNPSTRSPADPVLVIGAGPVGQTAALLLARWGVPVVVVDGRPERDPIGSKALVQQRDVIDVWCAVGVGDQIAREGVTWTRGRTFYRDHELFANDWVDNGVSPLPAFVNISQARTEQLMDQRIAESPLIEVLWGHTVAAITQDADAVRLRCETATGTVELTGTHAIACAGSRGGAIRQALGVTFDGESFVDPFLICDIRTDLGAWSHERRFYFDPEWNPGRQVLVHPCPDSVYRIDWQVEPDYDLEYEESSGLLDARIRKIIGDVHYEITWRSVYRFHARIASRFRVGKVLLAGDLAHIVAPFGARGLNSGVQDADNAAWKIAYARHGWGDEDRLLESYHTERQAAAQENIDVSSATMEFLVPTTEEARTRRHATLEGCVDDPALRDQVDSGRLAEPYWYPDSPLITPDATRPLPERPLKGEYPVPAPGAIVPDFPMEMGSRVDISRFRQVAREGLLALVVTNDGASELQAEVHKHLSHLPCPVQVLSLPEMDCSGAGRRALRARNGEIWIIRPDAHIAAVVTSGEDAAAACRRTLGASWESADD